jgi:hypothetical protein
MNIERWTRDYPPNHQAKTKKLNFSEESKSPKSSESMSLILREYPEGHSFAEGFSAATCEFTS